MIEIISPGLLSSIQDLGRPGYRSIGVGLSGAMDSVAMRVANMLVGNDENAPVIEVTLGGMKIRFSEYTRFALGGANCQAELNGRVIPTWWICPARRGDVLKLKIPQQGMRSYLAIAGGGFDVPEIMGSRSTDLKGLFGGLEGRPLKRGDLLNHEKLQSEKISTANFGVSLPRAAFLHMENEAVTKVRVIPAAERDHFNEKNQQLFLTTEWQVEADSNRIGYRLEGPALEKKSAVELASHGILPGTIQVPPSGKPVIQLNDANTCGGYPKVAAVIQADLHKLAQIRPGQSVRFCLTTHKAAHKAANKLRKALDDLVWQIETIKQKTQSQA